MKTNSHDQAQQFNKLMKRAVLAYSGAIGIVVLALAISIRHGAGWKPALAGMPLYVTIFAAVTYQFVKELRALKRPDPKDEV